MPYTLMAIAQPRLPPDNGIVKEQEEETRHTTNSAERSPSITGGEGMMDAELNIGGEDMMGAELTTGENPSLNNQKHEQARMAILGRIMKAYCITSIKRNGHFSGYNAEGQFAGEGPRAR